MAEIVAYLFALFVSGSEIPSLEQLCNEFETNSVTVHRSICILREECGIVIQLNS